LFIDVCEGSSLRHFRSWITTLNRANSKQGKWGNPEKGNSWSLSRRWFTSYCLQKWLRCAGLRRWKPTEYGKMCLPNAILHNDLELRHPRCVCTNMVGCKEVKNTTSLGMSKVVLIKRHVSAYSEAIFRFYKC
jgi:hypothetical protein